MRLRHASVSCAMAVAVAGSVAEPASAGFEIAAHQVAPDPAARHTAFAIEFTTIPDFFTAGDAVGTERHAFQAFIDADPHDGGDPFFGPGVSVVRGPEIRFDPDHALRVRATDGPDDGDPANGGWGPVRGRVPYELDGTVVRFALPWDVVADSDGVFAYVLESYEDGGLTSSVTGPVVVPLPPGAWTGLSVLGGMWVVWLWRGRRGRVTR